MYRADTRRLPDTLFKGLASTLQRYPALQNSLQLLLIGPENPATKEAATQLGVLKNMNWSGLVSYEESLKFMARAHVCVLVDCSLFDEGMFLPSKLCDYLASRKPVLALAPAVGTVNDLAREGGGIIRLDLDDVNGVAAAIKQLFDAHQLGRLHEYAPPASLSKKFDMAVVARTFYELVQRYAGGRYRSEARMSKDPIGVSR
jgi:glycosyltransferase involved in cell wall biosynthesis